MIPELSEIETLARTAGEILRAGFRSDFRVMSKSEDIDLVTEMDARSEAYLLTAILEKFPDHHIITEETGSHGAESRYSWYLDPIDGTVNYAHGIPIFSVCVAFAVDRQVIRSAVYDPMQDECFTAERGQGAWSNGSRLNVSKVSDLGRSLLVTGFPYDIWSNPVNNLDNFSRFSVRTQGVRRLGSAALDLCYVAAGRFDGFWELRLKSWDIAAAGLVAEEAGARVTTMDGEPDYVAPVTSIIAANPALHAEIYRVLKE